MKLSIIAEGGGMRGAYALGAIDALYSHFGLKRVDYVTGSSGSIATLAYYISGQFYPGYYIWPNELPSHKFLSFRNLLKGYPFLNVDYLIDQIFKEKIPLKENKVKESKIKLFIPLTNAETGEVEYFNNKTKFDFFDILRAAMAIPFVYNKTVKIGNQTYLDGGVSDPLPVHIPEIKNSRKIIILTKPLNSTKLNLLDGLMLMLFKLKFKPTLYNSLKLKSFIYKERLNDVKDLELNGDILVYPSKKMSKYDNNRKTILENIKNGYQDTISNKKIEAFIKDLKKSNKHYFTE